MSRGLNRSEEWLAERELRLKSQNKQKDVHLDRPKRTKPVDRVVNAPKYRNQKVEVDGIKFDSKKEAKRWQELKLAEGLGNITNLRTQVRYTLIPAQKRTDGTTERKVEYVADFSYDAIVGAVVEDVKGMKTPMYILKRKLMLWVHGITVKEI